MARPRTPEDLAAELELLDLQAIAKRADRALWRRARQLVDERRMTVEQIARALGIPARTVARRLPPRAGQGSP